MKKDPFWPVFSILEKIPLICLCLTLTFEKTSTSADYVNPLDSYKQPFRVQRDREYWRGDVGYIGGLSLVDRLSWEAAEKLNIAAESGRRKSLQMNPQMRRQFNLNFNMNFNMKRVSLMDLPKYHLNRVSRIFRGRNSKVNQPVTWIQRDFERLNRDHEALLMTLIDNEHLQELRELWDRIVVNPLGVTCPQLCEPPGSIFAMKGFCTRDYCRCFHMQNSDAGGGQTYSELAEDYYQAYFTVSAKDGRCRKGQVFDPVRLACADPRSTILCSDHQQESPVLIPQQQQPQLTSLTSNSIYDQPPYHNQYQPQNYQTGQFDQFDYSNSIDNGPWSAVNTNAVEEWSRSSTSNVRGFLRETQNGWVMAPASEMIEVK